MHQSTPLLAVIAVLAAGTVAMGFAIALHPKSPPVTNHGRLEAKAKATPTQTPRTVRTVPYYQTQEQPFDNRYAVAPKSAGTISADAISANTASTETDEPVLLPKPKPVIKAVVERPKIDPVCGKRGRSYFNNAHHPSWRCNR
jgi:hypothetical protein